MPSGWQRSTWSGTLPIGLPITLGADKGYDAADFVEELRMINVRPHVVQNATRRRSAIDQRTTRHPGYATSQRIRKRIEEAFGWIKTVAGMRKTELRGRPKVDWAFTFAAARRLESRDPLGYGQTETNEETTSQTTPQSPSETSSTAINTAPGLIRPAIPSTERLALRATAVPASAKLTSTAFPNCRIYGSGNGVDLIAPSMDHRVAVEVVDEFDNALLQFVL
jgi:hypothetical protein